MRNYTQNPDYCESLTEYRRRKAIEVDIGGVPLGGKHPIRIQSMTTTDTMDTRGSVEQIKRLAAVGCEYVRLTAPGIKEAENLQNIKAALKKEGVVVPLVADIHFTPNAALAAARIVEKVRINPGNYADKKKFEIKEYSDSQYLLEIERIREKFLPLLKVCREHGTALRIGSNHGSLSDRIMGRYGDTPLGMVESALEFLRICEDEKFYNVVLSMKSSNPQVMVQAYRLLVNKMENEGLKPYPLHLGVTEAGEGEDGRTKSAMGIGALLEDGLGDTVRVSLTEEPEAEVPVAKMLVDRYTGREGHKKIPEIREGLPDPFIYKKRSSGQVYTFGDKNVPRVIADFSDREAPLTVDGLSSIGHFYLNATDKWAMGEQGADFIYTGNNSLGFMAPNGLKQIMDYQTWLEHTDKENTFPLLSPKEFTTDDIKHSQLNFVRINSGDYQEDMVREVCSSPATVILLESKNRAVYPEMRAFFAMLERAKRDTPVVIRINGNETTKEQLILQAATDAGALFIDGLGDGLMISSPHNRSFVNPLAFGVLQAARTRTTKTEYISCPSCGRTLFDLQETTALIRGRTDHLKGIKIGIMGCIVNGPGEMADADYGYVGSGKGKITLYRGQNIVKRGVPSENAVEELIAIIKEDGTWTEQGVK